MCSSLSSLFVFFLSFRPRNFHSVSDLCEDVKVEDFLLLNGDLTFVHVASAADLPSSTDAASGDILGHPLPGPSSSASSSSLDRQPSPPSFGASTSSVSIINPQHQQLQQLQQNRGWMSLSSSSRQRTLCSSAIGADRSTYVEIDASLKGLLDIGVHRIPLHARGDDVACPSSDRFPCRRKVADKGLSTVSGTASNRVSIASLSGSDSCSISPSSSFASVTTIHTPKSELANPGDVTASAPSGVEKLTRNCETVTGSGSNEHSLTKLESKKKMPNRPASPGPPSSVPTPRATPLPPAEQKGESGNSRGDTLEQCRIVLCDIKSPSSSTDLNSIKCDARKGVDKPATVIHRGEEEKEERKKPERKQTVHNNEHTGTANSFPVKSPSVIDKTTGFAVKASRDLTPSLNNVPVAASQRSALGSSERGMANGLSSSGVASATVTHQRLSVFSSARRRAASRELVDGGVTSKPEVSQPESLIPVLEKHGSDDETPPVENEEDVCGESYDDEREMPQLTLYA